MQDKNQQLEPDMEQQSGSKLGKEYVKALYCHLAYLTYMQSASYEMPGWMKHKPESRLPGEISITSDIQMTPSLRQKAKRNYRASWWKWERRVKKAGLKQHSKNKEHGIWSHHFMTNRWGNNGNSERLYFLGLRNLQMVTVAMKLKDACSLEEKLWPTYYFTNKGPYSQSYGLSSNHVWMWELDHKKSWEQKIDAYELWCWRRLLRVPWTARRSNQSILKEISPENSLERLTLKLKLQYFGPLMWRTDSLEKTLVNEEFQEY